MLSQYPIIEFYPGDRIELVTERGRIREIVFKTVYQYDHMQYVLYEHYGYGYITYELYRGNSMVDLHAIPQTANLVDVAFGTEKTEERYMMAVPIQFYESGKWDERGQSVLTRRLIPSMLSTRCGASGWMPSVKAGPRSISPKI